MWFGKWPSKAARDATQLAVSDVLDRHADEVPLAAGDSNKADRQAYWQEVLLENADDLRAAFQSALADTEWRKEAERRRE